MATVYPIKVNGTTIKTPTTLKFSRYTLTKPGRVANGKMHFEFVAKKKKLFLTYAIISSTELKAILDLIDPDSNQLFFEVRYYDENNTLKVITCYVGEIPSTLQRRASLGGPSYWKDVAFNFIEQ